MKVKTVRIQKYQNIVDSELVEIDQDITCLVGKNESGKTAFLQALHKLNPHDDSTFDALDQYPRWKYKFDERKGEVNSEPVITVEFELSDDDTKIFEDEFGEKTIKSNVLTVSKYYDDNIKYEVDLDRLQIFKSKLLSLEDNSELRKSTSQKKSTESLHEVVSDYKEKGDQITPNERQVISFIDSGLDNRIEELAESLIPLFFYFSEYSTLPGRIKLEDFLSRNKN